MHIHFRLNVVPILSLSLLVATATGCGKHTQSRLASQLPTPGGPIAVEATVDGPASISTSLDNNVPNVIVHFGDKRQVIVEQARILVDGETYPAAPAGTKKISIDITDGQVTLQADGQPLSK
jgi:hypothetical protein